VLIGDSEHMRFYSIFDPLQLKSLNSNSFVCCSA
jgi:hypothetical protein